MTPLIRTELRKLRSTRIGWLVVLAAQLIVIAGVSGLVASGENLRSSDTVVKAVAHVGLASLCALLLGIYAMAGEYRHRTITDTYLSTPRRDRVLAAKLVTYLGVGLAMGIAAAVTALVVTKVWWSIKGVPLSLTDAGIWRTLVGGIAWNAGFAILGVGLGAAIRNLSGAIAGALAWIALVEGIVGQLVGSEVRRWLPFAAGQSLGRVTLAGSGHLSQWAAAAVLAGYAVVVSAVAASITLRRDVT